MTYTQKMRDIWHLHLLAVRAGQPLYSHIQLVYNLVERISVFASLTCRYKHTIYIYYNTQATQ